MLPVKLIRARRRRGRIRASYLDPSSANITDQAEELIELFHDAVGNSYGELAANLKEAEGATPRFRITRGLARMLHKRTEVVTESPCDPQELRRRVFELAAEQHPVVRTTDDEDRRGAILTRVADELETTPEIVERSLYADLKDAQVIESFEPIEPRELVDRYNVALAQGILIRATELVIDIELSGDMAAARFRQLFRYLKFFQLLHTIELVDDDESSESTAYRITIDGPMSMFRNTGRYGFNMACFLPALLLCDGWSARANVLWGPERVPSEFQLTADSQLESHYRDRGVYLTEEQRFFVDRFEKREHPWELIRDEPLVPLAGQALWIPDFRIRNTDDGREAYLEIIGYWRADYLRRRLEMLAEHGPPNLILGVSDKMRVDDEELEKLPVEVIFFKKVLRARLVLDALERVAH